MAEKMNPVGWFEIPVEDLDRAKSFYDAVFEFDLELHDMGPMQMAWFPMIEGVQGAPGALVKMDGYKPSDNGIRIYFTAPDIDATLEKAAANGGEILMPRTSIGEYGFIAQFRDTEGNRIAIHSME
jgi:predicted enzyme related to lactoylglutathione lyase